MRLTSEMKNLKQSDLKVMDQRLYSGESSRYCTVDAAALPDKMLI